ncbi:MAG: response regulator [Bacteroidales bacterium]|nr:response regulator [Bacteroidales bacterium]
MKKPTVLIVDPDEYSRLLLEETFQMMAHYSKKYQVLSTASGKEAIHFCHAYKIELIFTEIRLKDMDGWQLIQKIKELYPSIPIIIQTAVITDDIERMVGNSGADSYLAKPINIYEMQKKVQRVL